MQRIADLVGDERAPSRARRFVVAVLAEAGLIDLADVAALLVTELTTNAVVHGGSAVQVEVTRDDVRVTVAVRDADTGPVVTSPPSAELGEGGRGLLLVDALAESWGTAHRAGRKTVWFTLAPGPVDVASDVNRTTAEPLPAVDMERRLAALVLEPRMRRSLTPEEQLGELASRIADTTDCDSVEIWLELDPALKLRRGALVEPTHRLPVWHGDRQLGTLGLHRPETAGPPDLEILAFWRVAAALVGMVAAEAGLLELGRRREDRLDLLAEATELLAGSLDVSLTLALVAQIVVPRIAEWCAVYEVDERGRTRRVAAHHIRESELDALAALVDRDADVRAIVAAAARSPGVHRPAATVPLAGRRAHVAALPLHARSRTLGVLLLGRVDPLVTLDLMTAEDLTRRAALAVDNARLYATQADTAGSLQRSLLAAELPTPAGWRLAARYHSASPGLAVGGDFYDAFELADGSTVVAVGDVCGKGAQAAAITGVARDVLRLLLTEGYALPDALRRLNTVLRDRPDGSRFCTVALCRLSPTSAGARAELCLAGHPEPVHVSQDGARLVGTPGTLIGVLDDEEVFLPVASIDLAAGDLLVLYTDGVTERRDGERMFGQHGLLATLRGTHRQGAEQVALRLEGAAEDFVEAPLRDDLAIVVVRLHAAD
ncbi:MAG TPA: SpoIIE family protein phosphatase [Mycobacteriales bacterium]|nr:SpoIIE family protein phosphatase [Mycobacteriales bacterium]